MSSNKGYDGDFEFQRLLPKDKDDLLSDLKEIRSLQDNPNAVTAGLNPWFYNEQDEQKITDDIDAGINEFLTDHGLQARFSPKEYEENLKIFQNILNHKSKRFNRMVDLNFELLLDHIFSDSEKGLPLPDSRISNGEFMDRVYDEVYKVTFNKLVAARGKTHKSLTIGFKTDCMFTADMLPFVSAKIIIAVMSDLTRQKDQQTFNQGKENPSDELDRLKDLCSEQQMTINRLKAKLNSVSGGQNKQSLQGYDAREEQRKLNKLQKQYDKLMDKYQRLLAEEEIDEAEGDLLDAEDTETAGLRVTDRIYFCRTLPNNLAVAGMDERLKAKFPNSNAGDNIPVNIDTYDAVVILTRYMKHGHYWGVRDTCKRRGVPVYHCFEWNVDAIARRLEGGSNYSL